MRNELARVGNTLEPLGFVRERSPDRDTVLMSRVHEAAIRHEVCITAAAIDEAVFGCTARLVYHARARDRWSDDGEPFLIEVWARDLLPHGLDVAGTPGSLCWNLADPATFLAAFRSLLEPKFAEATTIADLVRVAEGVSRENPRNAMILMALGFMWLELGDRSRARSSFEVYFERFPPARKRDGHLIDALLTS